MTSDHVRNFWAEAMATVPAEVQIKGRGRRVFVGDDNLEYRGDGVRSAFRLCEHRLSGTSFWKLLTFREAHITWPVLGVR